jgi:hypothetical protein
MADYTHTRIEEIDAISGVLEGLTFYKAAGGLGVESFGISIVDLAAGATDYPEHVARVGPEHKRKVLPGADGLRLLIVGGAPG